MNIIDGGCFVTLGDSLVVMDIASIEDFSKSGLSPEGIVSEQDQYCTIQGAKQGLWVVYGLVDESRLCSMTALAAGEFDPQIITTDYLTTLPWQFVRGMQNQNVKVPSGIVGVFCRESIAQCLRNNDLNNGDSSTFLDDWTRSMQDLAAEQGGICLSDIPNGPVGSISSIGNSETCRCEGLTHPDSNEIWGWRLVF